MYGVIGMAVRHSTHTDPAVKRRGPHGNRLARSLDTRLLLLGYKPDGSSGRQTAAVGMQHNF